MDACTFIAADGITIFAVRNPNWSSQNSRFFQFASQIDIPTFGNITLNHDRLSDVCYIGAETLDRRSEPPARILGTEYYARGGRRSG